MPGRLAVDQRQLNGDGPGAYRHELSVSLPKGQVLAGPLWPLGEPGDTVTWAKAEDRIDGSTMLRVVLATDSDGVTNDERGVMTGELAEAWWRIVSP